MQSFAAITDLSVLLLSNATAEGTESDAITNVAGLNDALAWTSFRAPLPWESDASEDTARAGAAAVGERLRGITGTSAPDHVLRRFFERERDFDRVAFWATCIAVLLCFVHYPAVSMASRSAAKEKRSRLRHRQERVRQRTKPGDDEGPSMVERFSHTWPRFEFYLLALAQQTLAQRCAFAMSAGAATSDAKKVGAALMFLAWPVGFTYYVYRLLHRKLVDEKRATLVRQDKRHGGFLVWVDNPPMETSGGHAAASVFFSGFVARYGATFEDMKERAVGTAMPVFLVQRVLVGVAIGTVQVGGGLSGGGGTQRHVAVLAALFFALTCWLAYVRPFLVPLANFFEGLVALSQCACVLLNLWISPDDTGSTTVLGVTMSAESAARHMNVLMMVALGAMILRYVSVYLPTYWALPQAVYEAAEATIFHRTRERKKLFAVGRKPKTGRNAWSPTRRPPERRTKMQSVRPSRRVAGPSVQAVPQPSATLTRAQSLHSMASRNSSGRRGARRHSSASLPAAAAATAAETTPSARTPPGGRRLQQRRGSTASVRSVLAAVERGPAVGSGVGGSGGDGLSRARSATRMKKPTTTTSSTRMKPTTRGDALGTRRGSLASVHSTGALASARGRLVPKPPKPSGRMLRRGSIGDAHASAAVVAARRRQRRNSVSGAIGGGASEEEDGGMGKPTVRRVRSASVRFKGTGDAADDASALAAIFEKFAAEERQAAALAAARAKRRNSLVSLGGGDKEQDTTTPAQPKEEERSEAERASVAGPRPSRRRRGRRKSQLMQIREGETHEDAKVRIHQERRAHARRARARRDARMSRQPTKAPGLTSRHARQQRRGKTAAERERARREAAETEADRKTRERKEKAAAWRAEQRAKVERIKAKQDAIMKAEQAKKKKKKKRGNKKRRKTKLQKEVNTNG